MLRLITFTAFFLGAFSWQQSSEDYAELLLDGTGEQHFFDAKIHAEEYYVAKYINVQGTAVAYAFDTDSSSTGHVAIFTEEQFQAFQDGECTWDASASDLTCDYYMLKSGSHVSIVIPSSDYDTVYGVAFNPTQDTINVPRFHIHAGRDHRLESNELASMWCAGNGEGTRYVTVSYWHDSSCSGNPINSNRYPVDFGSSKCYCWRGRSGSNSASQFQCGDNSMTMTQWTADNCQGGHNPSGTVKTMYTTKCTQDVPPALHAKITDFSGCNSWSSSTIL